MTDIPFLSFDDPADPVLVPMGVAPAASFDRPPRVPREDTRDDPWASPSDADAARDAVAASVAGCEAARAGRWAAAAECLATSAAQRTALVARGRAGAAVAARGWSDVAVLAAARDDALGAADALARARAFAAEPGGVSATVSAALDEVTTWLGALGGSAALARAEPAPPVEPPPPPSTPSASLLGDLAADFATALVIEPIVPEPFAPPVARHAAEAPLEAHLVSAEPWAQDALLAPTLAAELLSSAPVSADVPVADVRSIDRAIVDRANVEQHAVDVAPAAPDHGPELFSAEWDTLDLGPDDAAPAVAVSERAPVVDVPDSVDSAVADAGDDVVFLAVEAAVDASPAVRSASDATPRTKADDALPWLDLEGPVRAWERADYVPPTPLPPPAARPLAPLAPPLAPALRRNHKIDEAVALATATPDETPGRLRNLLRRFRKG